MSHVDEGALHAYLDGALDEYPPTEAAHVRDHLETCQYCAIRLEAQRRIRNEASGILDLAAPQVEVPSLEELRAYVRETRPAPSSAQRRLYRMGWAASIMVALGVGWIARGGMLQQAALDAGFEANRSAPSSTAGDISAPSARAESLADELAQPASSGEGQSDGGAVGQSRSDTDVSAGLDRTAAPAANVAGLADDVARGVPAPPVDPDVATVSEAVVTAEEAEQVAKAGDDPMGPPASLDSLQRFRDALVASEERAMAERPAAPVADVGPQALRADPPDSLSGIVVTGSAGDREAARRAAPAAAPAEPEPALASGLALGGRTSTLAFDDDELDADRPLALPGYEVVSTTDLAEGTVPGGTHYVQRLPDGALLDIYHLPAGADPAALGPLPTGVNEVRAGRDGGWIVMRSALALEELEGLLATLVRGG